MSGTEKAPGLVWRKRRNGAQAAYWVARPDAVKSGYLPKSVRLHHDRTDPMLAARCHILQAEMLTWLSEAGKGRPAHYDGTFASLVRFYETHPDSPYFDLKPKTQRVYSKTLELLMRHKGKRAVAGVDGSDIRRWYKELTEAKSQSWAYFTVNVLKAVLSFGSTKRFRECRLLRSELRDARFSGGRRRTQRITFEQVVAFRREAHRMNLGWMALTLTLQFALGMRRRDVIGEWVRAQVDQQGIRRRNMVWRDGLTWGSIDEEGVIRKLVSKTEFSSAVVAVHTIADYPDLVEELAIAGYPSHRRVGPIIINPQAGLPPNEKQCRRYFRKIARACGIPDDIWNMDARAGADTEAYEAGATEEEAMALLTHTERSTNRGYLRDLQEQSHRAAVKRVGSRGRNDER